MENELITIDDRKLIIPSSLSDLCVEGDTASETVHFRIPKTYDGNDLSIYPCYISFENASKQRDRYHVNDLTVEDDYITFSWKIDGRVSKSAGALKFVILFEKVEGDKITYSWSTTPATVKVLAGIKVDGTIIEDHPTILQSMLQRLADLEARIK
jgi:hypothetical protein